MTRILRAADLFCGAGGTTTGAHQSSRVEVHLAINHWRVAVNSHRQNHPGVRHICAEIDRVDPRDFEGMGIDVLMASPECTHHANARGGKPVDDQRRATAWCVPRWAEVLRPKWIIVENVREFEGWGPLGHNDRPLKSKKGEIFQAWIQSLRALNYHVEWRLLNAADFGGATKRVRLFVVGRRGPSKQPIPWPAATHSREQWAPAWSIIDWTKPCPSIFTRKVPLAEKTLRRIEFGLRKFCGPAAQPFIVPNFGERDGQQPRTHGLDDPLPTVTSHGAGGLVQPFLVAYHCGQRPGDGLYRQHSLKDRSPGGRVHPVDEPLGAITSKRGKALCLPFLTEYFGTGTVRGVDEPLSTLTTKHRHGLVMVQLINTMRELGSVDIGFRMLDVDELARAQGFPPGYFLFGTQAEQIKQVGNSVHTAVAKALCQAIGEAA